MNNKKKEESKSGLVRCFVHNLAYFIFNFLDFSIALAAWLWLALAYNIA